MNVLDATVLVSGSGCALGVPEVAQRKQPAVVFVRNEFPVQSDLPPAYPSPAGVFLKESLRCE